MMVQSMDEPDEIEGDDEEDEILNCSSAKENKLEAPIRKLSLSQTRLLNDGSESDSVVEYLNTNQEDSRLNDLLGKTKQYQTFESSSSTNSELSKKEEFDNKSKQSKIKQDDYSDSDSDSDSDDDNQNDNQKLIEKEILNQTSMVINQPPNDEEINIYYSSGEVSSDSIVDFTNPKMEQSKLNETSDLKSSNLLNVLTNIKESESRENLLDEDDEDQSMEKLIQSKNLLSTLVTIEKPSSSFSPIQLTPSHDGSVDDVSITTVIERRLSENNSNNSFKPISNPTHVLQSPIKDDISSEGEEITRFQSDLVENESINLISSNASSDTEQEEEEQQQIKIITELIQEEHEKVQEEPKSGDFLQLEAQINQSESMEPLICQQSNLDNQDYAVCDYVEPDFHNRSPGFHNSSASSNFSYSTSDENLLGRNKVETSMSTDRISYVGMGSVSSVNETINEHSQVTSKSLNFLESLVVPSSSNYDETELEESKDSDLSLEQIEQKSVDDLSLKTSQSLNFKATRPNEIDLFPSLEIDQDSFLQQYELQQKSKFVEQFEQEQQTPTPVENIVGDFFDKRVTSSNEPSIDRLTNYEDSQSLYSPSRLNNKNTNTNTKENSQDQEENEILENKVVDQLVNQISDPENAEAEVAAAVATALLFSSTVKSQSSDEIKSQQGINISQVSNDQIEDQIEDQMDYQSDQVQEIEAEIKLRNEEDESILPIKDATPRAFTKYIVLSGNNNENETEEEITSKQDDESRYVGIDNIAFEDSDENQNMISESSSHDSIIINHEYDDSEDQRMMKIKIIQSSIPSKSFVNLDTSQVLQEQENEIEPLIEENVLDEISQIVSDVKQELDSGNIQCSMSMSVDSEDASKILYTDNLISNLTGEEDQQLLDEYQDTAVDSEYNEISNQLIEVVSNLNLELSGQQQLNTETDSFFQQQINENFFETEKPIEELKSIVQDIISNTPIEIPVSFSSEPLVPLESTTQFADNKEENEKFDFKSQTSDEYSVVDSEEITRMEKQNPQIEISTCDDQSSEKSFDLEQYDGLLDEQNYQEEIKPESEPQTDLNSFEEPLIEPAEPEVQEKPKEIRTKDGILLDDQAFLICTPTPTSQTPENEIEIDSSIEKIQSDLNKNQEIEMAKSIVQDTIIKSINLISSKLVEEEQLEKDSFEKLELAKSIVENTILKSIEIIKSRDEQIQVENEKIQPIIKIQNTIGQQNKTTYSPKEVRFSNFVSTNSDKSFDSNNSIDTPNNTPSIIEDSDELKFNIQNVEKHEKECLNENNLIKELSLTNKLEDYHLESENRNLNEDDDQNLIEFSNLQKIILNSNYESTFNQMNPLGKRQSDTLDSHELEKITEDKLEEQTSLDSEESESFIFNDEIIVKEAKYLIENVVEKALKIVQEAQDDDNDEDNEEDKDKKKEKKMKNT